MVKRSEQESSLLNFRSCFKLTGPVFKVLWSSGVIYDTDIVFHVWLCVWLPSGGNAAVSTRLKCLQLCICLQ